MEVSQVRTPKSFYIAERKHLYSHPLVSFWRENFQNSVDAGAKNIHITVEPAKGKGSFGRHRSVEDVIRVVFEDDGCGMTPEIIDNVFFRPGESTKKDSSDKTGGFGRARLLTAYSQVRYSLVTGERAVEGDGPEYSHASITEMIQRLREMAHDLQNESPQDPRIADMNAEADLLESIAKKGPYQGLRLEVDMDPNEDPIYRWDNPSMDSLLNALTSYLKMSQVPCKVFVNGEERKERLLRGPSKRVLTAIDAEGKEQVFATVHTSKGEKAGFKGEIIVRVDGATMFSDHLSTDMQVVLELDTALARKVLTANRDSIREPYASAYEALKNQLVVDVRSALEQDTSSRIIPGTLGSMSAQREMDALDLENIDEKDVDEAFRKYANRLTRSNERTSFALSELEMTGYGGVPYGILKRFFDEAHRGGTFLSKMEDSNLIRKIKWVAENKSGVHRVRSCLEALDESDREQILAILHDKMEQDKAKAQAELDSKLKGMPDVRISVDGNVTGKVREAMRRNDPSTWDTSTGKGQRSRSLLVAWTILCEEAIRTAMRSHQSALPRNFEWTTGFLYAAPKEINRLNQSYNNYTVEAQHQKEGDKHYLVINPVDSNGVLKYNPRNPADFQKLAMLAAHEVAHIACSWHDEDFAALMTDIAANMDFKGAGKRVNTALNEIRDLYRRDRVTSQPMDTETGIRPSEKLVTAVAPATTISAGVMSSPENEDIPSPISTGLSASVSYHDDGTMEIDGPQLHDLEIAATTAFRDSLDEEMEMLRL